MDDFILVHEDKVLIFSYWNVNRLVPSEPSVRVTVLIFSYWNVNLPFAEDELYSMLVLIFSYWNVNVCIGLDLRRRYESINLFILECKYTKTSRVA